VLLGQLVRGLPRRRTSTRCARPGRLLARACLAGGPDDAVLLVPLVGEERVGELLHLRLEGACVPIEVGVGTEGVDKLETEEGRGPEAEWEGVGAECLLDGEDVLTQVWSPEANGVVGEQMSAPRSLARADGLLANLDPSSARFAEVRRDIAAAERLYDWLDAEHPEWASTAAGSRIADRSQRRDLDVERFARRGGAYCNQARNSVLA
jgi:hypothetical protein